MGYYLPKMSDFTEGWLVVPEGGGGSWDIRLSGSINPCCMIRIGSTLHLYYIGADGDRGDSGPANRALGVTTSTDFGETWSKYGSNPIITFQPNVNDEEGVFSATILKDGSNYRLYYGGLRGPGGGVDIEIRGQTSTDGFSFGSDSLIYQSVGNEVTPVGCYIDGSDYYIYYIGPLAGGSGEWRLRSGTAWDTMATDQSVEAVSDYEGNGEVSFLDSQNIVMWIIPVHADDQYIDGYIIDKDAPTTQGTSDRTIDRGDSSTTRKSTLFLDDTDDIWYMIYREESDEQIYLRKAKAIRRTRKSFSP